MKNFKAFIMSMGMYSVIPVPNLWEDSLFSRVLPAFPFVGLVISAIWFGLACLLRFLNLPIMIFAVIMCLAPMILSGFIHMDGLMDTSDAIFSRANLEKRRAILKDSHVGAFAVIVLFVYLLFSFSLCYTIIDLQKNFFPLIFIPVLSRCISGISMLSVKPIWDSGYGATFNRSSNKNHIVFISVIAVLTVIFGFVFGGVNTLLVLTAVLIGGSFALWFSTHELKGISGDLCGFILCIAEICGLVAMTII